MRRRNEDLVKLSITALMMALAVILNSFVSAYINIGGVNLVKVGFYSIPVTVVSIVCGPLYGAICGAGADLISALCFPTGAFFPGFTFDAMLFGLLPSFFMKLFKGKRGQETIVVALLTVVATLVLSANLPFTDSAKLDGGVSFELSTWLKVLIPFIFVVLMAVYAIVFFFVKPKKKKETNITGSDIILCYTVRDLGVKIYLAPLWLYLVYGIDYSVSFITQSLTSLVTIPLMSALCYLVMIPVSAVAKSTIADTYKNDKPYLSLQRSEFLTLKTHKG